MMQATMMLRITILLLAGLLAGAAALAATPPVVVEPRDDALGLGLGRASAPPVASTQSAVTAPVAASAGRVPSGNPLWAIPLRQLSATRERPLFAPSRRPLPPVVAYQLASAPPPPPPKPAEPEKPRLLLVGTIAGEGTEGISVFMDPITRIVVRLKMGEGHEGWVLRRVRPREAILMKGSQIAVLTLPAPEISKAGPSPPAVAPRNRAAEGTDKNRAAEGTDKMPLTPSGAANASVTPSPPGGAPGALPAGAPSLGYVVPAPTFLHAQPPAALTNPFRELQPIRR